MSRVFIHGLGAVSPAGWGVAALSEAVRRNIPLPATELLRPGWSRPLNVRNVPAPTERPAFMAHPRLRRCSSITQHAVGAACEALGTDLPLVQSGQLRVALVICAMSGCVTYSRRFYEEVLNDPSLASPLLFPETVFNAPGSHLAAFLNSRAPSSTLVGDETTFLQGLTLAAQWLEQGDADGCLVLGLEEADWLSADALRHFSRSAVHAGGAGAVYLRAGSQPANAVELDAITDVTTFPAETFRAAAAARIREQLPSGNADELLCLSSRNDTTTNDVEDQAWQDWSGERIAPKRVLGEAFTAAAAWQCVAACDALSRGIANAAIISVLGTNQTAAGARFIRRATEMQP